MSSTLTRKGGIRQRRCTSIYLATQSSFRVIPTTVRCEGPREVVVAFDNDLPGKFDILLTVDDLQDTMDITKLNSKTVSFNAPSYCDGTVASISVRTDDVKMSAEVVDITYECDVVYDVMQVYHRQLNALCSLVLSCAMTSHDNLDHVLANAIFVDESIEKKDGELAAVAFEMLFGSIKYSVSDKVNFENPTLLHLAAKYGLVQLAAKLVDLPDSWRALYVENVNGHRPSNIAKLNSQQHMLDVLNEDKYSEERRQACSVRRRIRDDNNLKKDEKDGAEKEPEKESMYVPMTGGKTIEGSSREENHASNSCTDQQSSAEGFARSMKTYPPPPPFQRSLISSPSTSKPPVPSPPPTTKAPPVPSRFSNSHGANTTTASSPSTSASPSSRSNLQPALLVSVHPAFTGGDHSAVLRSSRPLPPTPSTVEMEAQGDASDKLNKTQPRAGSSKNLGQLILNQTATAAVKNRPVAEAALSAAVIVCAPASAKKQGSSEDVKQPFVKPRMRIRPAVQTPDDNDDEAAVINRR